MPESTPSAEREGGADRDERPRSLSMHAGVETWCDCCSCEPEPRWQAVEQEQQQPEAQATDRRSA